MLNLLNQADEPVRIKWTPETDARLRELVESGQDDEAIADVMGISLDAVRHRRVRLHIYRRRPENARDWTPELVERLIADRNAGYSAEQIAARLGGGLTRKAVLGKAFRLKLPRLARGATPKKARKAPGEKKARRRPVLRLVIDNTPDSETPIEQRRSLMELDDDTCRWPVGDVGTVGFFFCGAPSAGFTYCPKHHARAYKREAC